MDAREETKKHIWLVQKCLALLIESLIERSRNHDLSKLEAPEVEAFDKYTRLLKGMKYGDVEYKKTLKLMKPALAHHYEMNRHHPEHFENGIDGMNLIDIVEMFCDWTAAVQRHASGSFERSLKISAKRFNMSPQLVNIFRNTEKFIRGEGFE